MSVVVEKDTPRGRLVAVGVDRQRVDDACDVALAETSKSAGTAIDETWFKGSTLTGKAMWRHRARQLFLRAPLPRVNEYQNLEWLAARLFRVPRPLAAGVFARGGLPRYQFLVTERIQSTQTLREHFADAAPATRKRALATLAREAARMHSLGFIHRDLYPRNLLVGRGGVRYRACAGVALEGQLFPDAPHHAHFPSAVLRPGEPFMASTVYRLGALPPAPSGS